jgi:hypothetical protein
MRKFLVRLNGRNFLALLNNDTPRKCGFYSNRYVEADDERAAELAAVNQLRAKESLVSVVRNPPDDPPLIHLVEITEIASFDGVKSLDQGIIWYPENPTDSYKGFRRVKP